MRIKRPSSAQETQNILLDKGYDSDLIRKCLILMGYAPHIPYRENRVKAKPVRTQGRRKARRWVVERIGSWLNKFRRLKIRYERKEENYMAFVALACAVIIFRSTYRF